MENRSVIFALMAACVLLLVTNIVQIKRVMDLNTNVNSLVKEVIEEKAKSKDLATELEKNMEIVPAIVNGFNPPAPLAIVTPVQTTQILQHRPVRITLVGYFKNNSTEVNPEFEAELQSTVNKVQTSGKVSVIVKGFTNKTGSYDYNVKLSKSRADGVLSKVTSLLGDDNISGKASVGMGPSPDNKRKVVVVITTDGVV